MLPTPLADDGERGGSPPARRRARGHQVRLCDAAHDLAAIQPCQTPQPPPAPAPPALLPTPLADDATKSSRGQRSSRGDPALAAAIAGLPAWTT